MTSYVATLGTVIVHEHAATEGGRFSVEVWCPVLGHNVAKSGITISDDKTGCYAASRLHLVGEVRDVTARCPSGSALAHVSGVAR